MVCVVSDDIQLPNETLSKARDYLGTISVRQSDHTTKSQAYPDDLQVPTKTMHLCEVGVFLIST